jgi:tetratricopeptide (TPR) repeat protein
VLAVALVLVACAPRDPAHNLSPVGRRAMAGDHGKGGNDDAALDILREGVRRAPDDAGAQERYGLAAERARLYPEALAALQQAIAVGGPVPARLVAQGRIALQACDVPGAIGAYSRALEREPGDVDVLGGLGMAVDLQRRHAQAQAHYREALRLAPGDWGAQ